MNPQEVTYEITRHYLNDLTEANPTLVKIVQGYTRARNLAKLASCSSLFCWHSHSVEDWRFLRQVEAFFKKNSIFTDDEECIKASQLSFMESELRCFNTNRRLIEAMDNPDLYDQKLWLSINLMRRYISSVLGDFHEFISELPTLVKVTPGATAQSSRRNSFPQLKLKLKLFATRRSFKYLSCLYRYFGFGRFVLKSCEANRIELVPKDWRRHRTIACEPEGNIPLQLAFDTWVKRRLRTHGIDLRDQTANQRRAKLGSIDGTFCTIDFSNASDTISYETVKWLLPQDWFRYLSDVRSSYYRGVFGEGKYAKFSSMGNGATFALETLIFAAVCHALGSVRYLVYGDDVLIETRFYERFLELTYFLGFSVNVAKTFHEGPFRESCGKDYYNGIDVTPVYIRKIDDRRATLCHLVNTLRSVASPAGELWAYLNRLVETYRLPEVPYNENTLSGVWIDPFSARRKKILVTRAIRRDGPVLSYYKSYVASTTRRKFVDSRGYYLWFLRKNSQVLFAGPWDLSPFDNDVTITSSVPVFRHGYVRKWVVWHEPDGSMPDHILWSELFPRS